MTMYAVKIDSSELNKINCLTCKFGELSTGKPCFEINPDKWNECDEHYSKFESAKMLKLVLTYEWFDKIESGSKTSEFRRLCECWNKKFEGEAAAQYKIVRFQRGYRNPKYMFFQIKSIKKCYEQNDLNVPCCWEIKLGARIV